VKRLIVLALFAVACVGAAEPVPADAPQAFQAPLAVKAPLVGLALAGSRLVAVGDYGVIILSDDRGATWRQARAVATRSLLTAVTFVDASRGFAVGHGGVILRTVDGGETWARVLVREGEALLAVWFENARHGIAVGSFGLALETNDGGDHWRELNVGEGEQRDRHLNGIFALKDDGTLLVTAEAGTLFRSTDRGRTWTTRPVPYNGSLWGGLALRDGAVLVFGMRGHVLRSDDKGLAWTDVPTGTDRSVTGGVQLADGTIVLVGLGGVVLRSDDGGRRYGVSVRPERQTFTAVAEGATSQLIVTSLTGLASVAIPPR